MSFTIHRRLRESLAIIRKPGYTPSHISVLETLADCTNDKTLLCFPSEETIAEKSYLSERHVRKILRQLEDDGLVEIQRRDRKSNRYKLHLPAASTPSKAVIKGHSEPGFSGSEPASEKPVAALEAPLTSNSNQSTNPGVVNRDSGELVSEVALFFKEKSEKNSAQEATPEIRSLYGLLMKKVGSKSPEPSGRDIELLEKLLSEYGSSIVHDVLEWVFKQKNPFWKNALKKADFPCSYFVKSFATMGRQWNEWEEKRRTWQKAPKKTAPPKPQAAPAPQRYEACETDDDDYEDLEIDDSCLFEIDDLV